LGQQSVAKWLTDAGINNLPAISKRQDIPAGTTGFNLVIQPTAALNTFCILDLGDTRALRSFCRIS
jgi:hypothetical protein